MSVLIAEGVSYRDSIEGDDEVFRFHRDGAGGDGNQATGTQSGQSVVGEGGRVERRGQEYGEEGAL